MVLSSYAILQSLISIYCHIFVYKYIRLTTIGHFALVRSFGVTFFIKQIKFQLRNLCPHSTAPCSILLMLNARLGSDKHICLNHCFNSGARI